MARKMRFIVLTMMMFALIFLPSVSVRAEEDDEKIFDTRKYLGETVYAGDSEGYGKRESIDKDNPHYGWEIGNFFVSGFTRVTDDSDKTIVLKNVGDKVKLSFKLLQNIDKLNGVEGHKIGSDDDGYDESFGISKTDFGRGMLIVRKTDYQGKKEKPVLYKNYLTGVKLNADTEVELCEEGDYEVALDYNIQVDRGLQFWKKKSYDYRISFSFSVRNGNCMVYPFDVMNKSELTNTSITENGFYLDFAKSRYLDVDIKKQILNNGATGLVEDTRFNKPASDGEEFTEEGVYIITAHNKYTDQTTEKKIYVGDNDLLKAYVTTNLELMEIQSQLDKGATVDEFGKIVYNDEVVPVETDTKDNQGDREELSEKDDSNHDINIDIGKIKSAVDFAKKNPVSVAIGAFVVLILLILMIICIKKKIKEAKERRRIRKERKRREKDAKEIIKIRNNNPSMNFVRSGNGTQNEGNSSIGRVQNDIDGEIDKFVSNEDMQDIIGDEFDSFVDENKDLDDVGREKGDDI